MKYIAFLTIIVLSLTAHAKVDLVTLPRRDTVQLTIYNSADLTFVRESRALTLQQGENRLQFSWVNTLIDPTSLEMLPRANADKIEIADLTFPPRVKNLGLWNIESEVGGRVPVEINYFTSGLTWRAFYMGTLGEDETTMHLQGYVRVTNNSGEDYKDAQTRLIVGKVHILDQIAQLAQRQYPYDRPGAVKGAEWERMDGDYRGRKLREVKNEIMDGEGLMGGMGGYGVKAVKKEGLSEYFLYTIDGTETISNGWSKRLPSLDTDDIGVVNLYKYEEERYGANVMRFLSFANDEEHELGETPIPGGMIRVYRNVGEGGHLSYTGQSEFRYIPVDEEVELNLGAVGNVVVEPRLMEFETDNYRFDRKRNIDGWDEIRTYRIEVRNTRDIGVKVEIKRNFNGAYWDIEKQGDFGRFEKEDFDTVKFTLDLVAGAKTQFKYTVTSYHGTRR